MRILGGWLGEVMFFPYALEAGSTPLDELPVVVAFAFACHARGRSTVDRAPTTGLAVFIAGMAWHHGLLDWLDLEQ